MRRSLPSGLAPMGSRNYALFWVGYLFSNTGRWIELTGSVWLVYLLTDSPILLGLLGIVRAVPSVVLSPIAGVIADRVDQRRLLFVTQALGFGASLALGLLVATGLVELWHVYVQVAAQAAITAFDQSTRQALFPRLVPRTQLPAAVTLSATAARLATLAGPAIGGVAIASLGEASPFLLNAASLTVLVVALVAMTGIAPQPRGVGGGFRRELAEGLRYILRAPVLNGLIRMEVFFSIFSMNAVLITIVGVEILGVGPEGLGWLLAAPAVGSLVGIAGLVSLGHARRPGRLVVISTLIYAVAMIGFAVSTSYMVSFAILAVTGLIDAVVTITRHALVQLAAPGEMRGRVMANMGVVTRGLSPLAQTQSGLMAGILGAPLAGATAAIVLAVMAAATGYFNRSLWKFSLAEAIEDPDEDPDEDGEPGPGREVAATAGSAPGTGASEPRPPSR